MIVVFEDESMSDFVPFKHVGVEAQNPDVEDENCQSTPGREVSRKPCVILKVKIVYSNNGNQESQ